MSSAEWSIASSALAGISVASDQVRCPTALTKASFEAFAPQLQQASELEGAELVRTEAVERLILIACAGTVETAARAAVTGGRWLLGHERRSNRVS